MVSEFEVSDEFQRGHAQGFSDALIELRAAIQSDLDGSQTLHVDLPGLRKALLIIERMERE